jgi:transposase-like protein
MKPITSSLCEFQNRFNTEEECLAALEKLRWANGYRCPNCDHDVAYLLLERRLYQCAVCRHQTSVTAGTLFHKTRIPLVNWFLMIYLVAEDKGGASASRLSRQLGMHYPTVWNMLHKIRTAMKRRDDGILLSGVIELDEASIGKEARKPRASETKKNKNEHDDDDSQPPKRRSIGRPRNDGKTSLDVIVMVETEGKRAGSLAMKVIDGKTTRDAIREFVELRVEDERQIFLTDALQSHWVLRSMGHALDARVLPGEQSVQHLPWVHTAISLLRRFLMGTYHGVGQSRLQAYLDEFCFRFNRRFKETSIAESLLRACVFALPVQYAELKL